MSGFFHRKLMSSMDLSKEESRKAMDRMMQGSLSEVEMASLLTALALKGESAEEIASFARVMSEHARSIHPRVDGRLVDVCGTGGDLLDTFNISTTSMFLVSAADVYLAKHGNKAVTSKSGSADVLSSLDIDLSLDPEKVRRCIEEVGIGFMFAPNHHPAMKNVASVRKKLGIRTVFNLLGPLTNPAGADSQVIGVFDPEKTEKLARVLRKLNRKEAMIVHGSPGLDELSTLGKTKVTHLKNNEIETFYLKPEDLGLKKATPGDIEGGNHRDNASILRNILSCEETGPRRDIVLLNGAAGILVSGKADSIQKSLEIARDGLDSGRALDKLKQYRRYTHRMKNRCMA